MYRILDQQVTILAAIIHFFQILHKFKMQISTLTSLLSLKGTFHNRGWSRTYKHTSLSKENLPSLKLLVVQTCSEILSVSSVK